MVGDVYSLKFTKKFVDLMQGFSSDEEIAIRLAIKHAIASEGITENRIQILLTFFEEKD